MRKLKNYAKNVGHLVRDGLFLAPSRTYGEQYIEPLIRKKYNLYKSDSGAYDAKDKDGNHYEIKASKVLISPERKETLLERIIGEIENIETKKMISFKDSKNKKYLANIQNVKRDHFDYLIYVLLFEDCIKVFKVEKSKISNGIFKNWSGKHGRYDAPDKSGQFGISKTTIEWHLKNCYFDTITWEEAAEIYKGIKK